MARRERNISTLRALSASGRLRVSTAVLFFISNKTGGELLEDNGFERRELFGGCYN